MQIAATMVRNSPSKKLRCSINRGLIGKNEGGDPRQFVEGWENVEVIVAELAETVTNGIAYSAQLKGAGRTFAS